MKYLYMLVLYLSGHQLSAGDKYLLWEWRLVVDLSPFFAVTAGAHMQSSEQSTVALLKEVVCYIIFYSLVPNSFLYIYISCLIKYH